jgi:hypothetical protein
MASSLFDEEKCRPLTVSELSERLQAALENGFPSV